MRHRRFRASRDLALGEPGVGYGWHMADITIEETEPLSFKVKVDEDGSTSQHLVVVSAGDLEGLPDDKTPADLVEASFRFLLDREPKESVLSSFALSVISKYFPEYTDELAGYLE